MEKMTHEQMMGKAWRFIEEMGIVDDTSTVWSAHYKVKDIYQVRDAYYSELENGEAHEDDSVEAFFARHSISWQ